VRRTARNDEIMMFGSVIAGEAKQSYTIVIASEAKQSGIDRRLSKITRRLCPALTANAMAARVVLDSRFRGNDEFNQTPYFCASFPRKRESRNRSVIASEAKQSYTIVIASEAKQSGIDRQILACLRLLRSAALCAAPLAMTRI